MPAWLLTSLKHCLVTERHHKVLRRLLRLLAAVPSHSSSSSTGTQPACLNADSPEPHQATNARQETTGSDAHTIACSAAMPDAPDTADQASDATAALPSLSAPAASCSSSPPTTTHSFTAAGTRSSAAAPTAAPCTAATVTAAVQHYEQISSVTTQARHPSVKREGLQCLGAAVQSVIAALMPSQDQHPQHSQRNFQQHSQAAVACVSGDQLSGSQHVRQNPSAQQLGQTAADSARHERAGRGNSGSEEAQLRSSLPHEAEPRDSHSCSRSDSGPDQARLVASSNSQNAPQISGRAQFERGASEAQQAQREDQQTAHDLVDGFVDLVSAYSKAQQFDDMRLAAATALAASGHHIASPPNTA